MTIRETGSRNKTIIDWSRMVFTRLLVGPCLENLFDVSLPTYSVLPREYPHQWGRKHLAEGTILLRGQTGSLVPVLCLKVIGLH